MDNKWRLLPCPDCSGHGMKAHYSYSDFEGAIECRSCGGSGRIFIRPSGHIFEYPGGRALGMWSKEKYNDGEKVCGGN